MTEKVKSDRDALLKFLQDLDNIQRPEIKSIEVIPIMANLNGLLARTKKWTLENLDKSTKT